MGILKLMTIARFIASIDDCPESDLLTLSQVLKETLPEHAEMLRVAERQYSSARIQTLRFALKAAINTRMREENLPSTPAYTRPHRTLEQQEDHALQRSHEILGHISDTQWANMAEQAEISPEELRKSTWAKVFKAYRKYD